MARPILMSALFSRAKVAIYRWFDIPWVYRLTQATLAVGVERT
ncbi:unnamed protein product, partial [marine sediment metagenome]